MRSGQGHALERAWPKIVAGAAEAHAKGVTKSVDSDETTKKVARVAKRDAERSAGGGGGAGEEETPKSDEENVKALGGELSIWD